MRFYHWPRRLLVEARDSGGGGYSRAASFDRNMVIILAALLCALICALGVNSIVRCMLRCAARMNINRGEAPPQFGRKGLRKAALRHIPVEVYQGVGSTDCPICLGEFVDGDKMRVLPKCHHSFHVKCVDVWLASHTSCPTCRHSLAPDGGRGADSAAQEVA
ncbi:RING-H2 finger protein ATL74-like [Salvia miltiorrhiza]|uniref:RING-H2 finger protein ATL74-like n=1 Tax=Salvia miltiorrhiza TaxID=226208 RepID=UPI0025AC6082|nr:RING-H2 finger protein ATL74-like [Salvia miltiorrhiza]